MEMQVKRYDTSIPSLNTGCVKMLLSNLKIISGTTQGGRENRLQMDGVVLVTQREP